MRACLAAACVAAAAAGVPVRAAALPAAPRRDGSGGFAHAMTPFLFPQIESEIGGAPRTTTAEV